MFTRVSTQLKLNVRNFLDLFKNLTMLLFQWLSERRAPGLPAHPRYLQRLQARSNQDKSCLRLLTKQVSRIDHLIYAVVTNPQHM